MRFRSGTLERSVKRWGRFPRFNKVKRVNHSWKYVELENQAIGLVGGGSTQIVIASATDWQQNSSGQGVKNMSLDLAIGFSWTPVSDAANIFGGRGIYWGVFCLDEDDAASPPIATQFSDTRALKWGALFRNWQGMELTAADGGPYVRTQLETNFRVRCRQRFMKFDDELRFCVGVNGDMSSTTSDLRLHIFGRVSWETP